MSLLTLVVFILLSSCAPQRPAVIYRPADSCTDAPFVVVSEEWKGELRVTWAPVVDETERLEPNPGICVGSRITFFDLEDNKFRNCRSLNKYTIDCEITEPLMHHFEP